MKCINDGDGESSLEISSREIDGKLMSFLYLKSSSSNARSEGQKHLASTAPLRLPLLNKKEPLRPIISQPRLEVDDLVRLFRPSSPEKFFKHHASYPAE